MGGAASIIKKKEAFSSQSSPHGYRTRIQSYHCDNNNSTTAAAMEMSTGDLLRRIETLEQELKCKDNEIKSLNVSSNYYNGTLYYRYNVLVQSKFCYGKFSDGK